jgi:hypothetical protein
MITDAEIDDPEVMEEVVSESEAVFDEEIDFNVNSSQVGNFQNTDRVVVEEGTVEEPTLENVANESLVDSTLQLKSDAPFYGPKPPNLETFQQGGEGGSRDDPAGKN